MWTPAPMPTRTERAAALARRAIELIRLVARGLALLALAAASTVGAAWAAWVSAWPPVDANDLAARVVVLALTLLPPVVLGLFLLGLRELQELPARVRDLPADARAQLVAARSTRQGRQPTGFVAAIIRLARLALGSREALSPFAAITTVLRPALLLAALLGAVLAAMEIPVALVALVVILLS